MINTIFLVLFAGTLSSLPACAAGEAGKLSGQARTFTPAQDLVAHSTADWGDAEAFPKRANFMQESPSRNTRYIADWVVDSGDNHQLPFVIVDKLSAKVFVFNASGQLRGSAPALLGLALGDESVPGIGSRKLSGIHPAERTTPAGRFVAALGRNLRGEEILWVDYKSAISLHRVLTSNRAEHRAQRLASTNLPDKRISYGCINVPADFYETVVSPIFTGTSGIVYVLPDTRALWKIFPSYAAAARERLHGQEQ